MRKKLILILWVVILAISTMNMLKAEDNASAKSRKPSNAEIDTTDLSVAGDNIEQVFSKAAEAKKLNFSPEAKDVIIKEIINRESYKGVPSLQMSMSYLESVQLVDAIAIKARGEMVTADLVISVIVEEKVKQIREMLPDEISQSASISGIELTEGARKLLQADLLTKTERAAKSGLPIKEIKYRNEGYLKAIFASVTFKVLNEQTYMQIKSQIFQPLVKLTICSNPSGANVEIAGMSIGLTTIEDKPFEPGRAYTFIFKLSGYKTSSRKYFVTPYPPKQKFTEILIQEDVIDTQFRFRD